MCRVIRTHVEPQCGSWPLARIDHTSVQTWVTELGQQRSPELVAKCYQLTAAVLKSAVPDRLITFNPCDGVRLPRRRKQDHHGRVISQDELLTKLLPAAPERYRGLLATAASFKLFPKSAAGRRTVPSLGWLKFCRSTTKPIRRETPQRGRQSTPLHIVPLPRLAAGSGTSWTARHPHRHRRRDRTGWLDRRHRSDADQGAADRAGSRVAYRPLARRRSSIPRLGKVLCHLASRRWRAAKHGRPCHGPREDHNDAAALHSPHRRRAASLMRSPTS
jgi:hypothetical protein